MRMKKSVIPDLLDWKKDEKTMSKRIWDWYAPVYEIFMPMDEKVFPEMYARLPEVIRGKSVLEIATGPGTLAKRIAPAAGKFIATDYSEGMIKTARKGEYAPNLTFEIADATELPYREGEFDVVMIANALHVMPDPVSALKEIDRVLKPGGILIAPNFIHSGVGGKTRIWTGLLKLFGIRFERQWTAETYPAFLAENGWQVVRSEVMPARVTMMYTECVRAEEAGASAAENQSETGRAEHA